LRNTPDVSWGWLVFVVALALSRTGHGSARVDTPDDLAYQYSSSVAALVQYGFMLGILLLIARGLPTARAFRAASAASWRERSGLARLASSSSTSASFVYEQALSLFGDWSPTDEQGLVPTAGTRAAPARSSRSSSS
jgi:hypothetical protein